MKSSNFESAESNLDTMRNNLGCSMCLAKWTQVTMHLDSGLNHSCHHPTPHQIDAIKVVDNPMELHNSSYKKEQRKKMLSGQRPDECSYCWNIEDNTTSYSDRIFKSIADFSAPQFDAVKNYTGDEDVYPAYLEVSFGNTCNLKCTYCNPTFSSKWDEEIRRHGSYDIGDHQYHILIESDKTDVYLDAFWKWIPNALYHLRVIRITGGEPILNKNIFAFMEFIINNANAEIEIGINSHGYHSEKNWNRFVSLVNQLIEKKHKVIIFLSNEGIQEQSNYIRFGSKWNIFDRNTKYLLENSSAIITFMSTYSVYSPFTFTSFIDYVSSLKQQYGAERVFVDVSILHEPSFMQYTALPSAVITPLIQNHIMALDDNYSYWEREKIMRLQELTGDGNMEWLEQLKQFVTQYDQRRKTSLQDSIPELYRILNA